MFSAQKRSLLHLGHALQSNHESKSGVEEFLMEKCINLAFVGYPGANHSNFVPLEMLLQPFTPQQL